MLRSFDVYLRYNITEMSNNKEALRNYSEEVRKNNILTLGYSSYMLHIISLRIHNISMKIRSISVLQLYYSYYSGSS